jgi:hypothetical protein
MENKYAFQGKGKNIHHMIRYILMKLSQDLGEHNTEMGQKLRLSPKGRSLDNC